LNRSESRYFATVARMDEAFLTLLAKKDFEYITVKEICEVAGVNRSTFYLHYETMSDLLSGSVSRMNEQFLACMEKDSDAFSAKLQNCPRNELYLITPDYLTPYLSYIKNNKRLFRTATENAAVLGMDKSYDRMFRHVFTPILDRYGVLQQDRSYIMAFYIRGLRMAQERLHRFHYVCYRCDSAVCKNATKQNNERCLTNFSLYIMENISVKNKLDSLFYHTAICL